VWTEKVKQPILLSERAKEMFNMAKNQKSYTPKFKQQIVDLYNGRRNLVSTTGT
jgi:transposase